MIEAVLIFALAIGLILGVYAGLWWLWCWAVPQVWVTGPENLLHPPFLVFVGLAILTRWLLGGRSSAAKTA